jgi:hypothetical protein
LTAPAGAQLWQFRFMQFDPALQNLMNDTTVTDMVLNGVRSALVRSAGRWFSVRARGSVASVIVNCRR